MRFYAQAISTGNEDYTSDQITEDLLAQLAGQLASGKLETLTANRDCGHWLEMYIENGWAAIMLTNEPDGIWHYYRNKKYNDMEDEAPVDFAGQNPAPKPLACDDLGLAAQIFLQYAHDGTRYPTDWACWTAEAEDFTEF